METTDLPQVNSLSIPTEQLHIQAKDLLTTFNRYADTIKVLSLDCFDTLLWRKTISPKDVFFDLQQYPTFKALDIAAIHRIDAESSARSLMAIRQGHFEVNLSDIYQTGFPTLSATDITNLIEEEIAAEIAACYAFPPTVDLMRAAHTRGIKIIIVSNTYLQKMQLSRLLEKTLPKDVFAMIDTVFCSCDYQQSKTDKLFDSVLLQLGEAPQSILHIGDTEAPDFDAPRLRGMQALHLIQFNSKVTEYLRLQSTAATLADTSVHATRSMLSPFRGIFASHELRPQQPESLIGYLSMGPIMYTFARYITEEIQQVKNTKPRLKVLFLLRDAHLPFHACRTLTGMPVGTFARISRFSAIAASFRSEKNVAEYITGSVVQGHLDHTCRQLLLPDDLTNQLIAQAKAAHDPIFTFCQLILEKNMLEYIFQQSKVYFARFKKYLQNLIQLEAGDTLMFVDLGYLGRTQTSLTPVLENEGIEVTGRYLILLNAAAWKQSRRGLIEPSWCDDRTSQLLSLGNTLLEELTCSPDHSVEDYDNDGNPIFANASANAEQQRKTALIQAECLRFVRDAKNFFDTAQSTWPVTELRDSILAELIRRTCLPMREEIEYLQEYLHDENLGTNLACSAIENIDHELKNLRRRGLSFKNQNPYSLRLYGFELALTLAAQYRLGFEVSLDDLNMRHETIIVMTAKNQKISKQILNAAYTYDGYFALRFLVDHKNVQTAILFGLNYESIQLECVELIQRSYFYHKYEFKNTLDLRSTILLKEMHEKKSGFFECLSDAAALIIQLPHNLVDEDHVLRVVFRPIIKKQ